MYLSTFTTTTLSQTTYCEWGPVAILAGGFCFLLIFVFCGGPKNWCSCAPLERAAGKCHCFSIARAGEASWLEICSVAHSWVLQSLACGRAAEEEQRRWQPWFSCRFFKVDERENANTNTYQWYIHTVTSLVVSNFLVV